jgi:lipoprotein NlpD
VATPPKPVSKPPTTKVKPAAQNKQQNLGPVTRWLWPGKGPVERAYSAVLHKGIDIAGQRGDPVYATAAGVVVYAGTGLKGYGALLIVKHNEQFLSAYGHNEVMLVAEGTNISAGQQIARMGSSGTDTVKLHFEIRRKGQPVDPLRLLPRR